MHAPFSLSGRIVDLHERRVFPGVIHVSRGRIDRIEPTDTAPDRHILPGFVDAHVHVESSMLTPSEFARAAVVHGTVGSVSDPHEIANVLGMAGVEFMIEDGRRVPFHFAFGAPSCVPATSFETAGARLDPEDVDALLARPDVRYLSEMMNFPGVLNGDPEVRAKLDAAERRGKPRDGHAPGLRGASARAYVGAGIQTDHECFSLDEAREKVAAGMKILIREGSAAKNFDELIPLLAEAPDQVMFCSDDKHPDSLMAGHIDDLVRRAIGLGYDRFDVLRAACIHPVEHYGLEVGLLRPGDPADFVVVDDLQTLTVLETYVGGRRVAKEGRTLLDHQPTRVVNQFGAGPVRAEQFRVPTRGARHRVITAVENQLVTGQAVVAATRVGEDVVADPDRDILKVAVVNRYHDADPAVAFVQGFGLRRGAMASSVAHDSHNIVAVGASDHALAVAVNAVIAERGGISATDGAGDTRVLPLPIAGLMSDRPFDEVARGYSGLTRFVRDRLAGTMDAPFMTLSFLALLVIPRLKLSDQGLFDGETFEFVDLFVD